MHLVTSVSVSQILVAIWKLFYADSSAKLREHSVTQRESARLRAHMPWVAFKKVCLIPLTGRLPASTEKRFNIVRCYESQYTYDTSNSCGLSRSWTASWSAQTSGRHIVKSSDTGSVTQRKSLEHHYDILTDFHKWSHRYLQIYLRKTTPVDIQKYWFFCKMLWVSYTIIIQVRQTIIFWHQIIMRVFNKEGLINREKEHCSAGMSDDL